MHIDGELEAENAEHCLEKAFVVQYLLAVANVFVQKAVEDGDNLLQLEVLDLINQVIAVLWPVHARHWDLVLSKFLGVDVSLNLAIDVENDGL